MTKSTFFVEEDKILTALFDEGLDCLHLNKPGAAPVYSERLLTLLPDQCYRNIVVHENFYLKEEYSLRGIHLESDATPVPQGYRGQLSRTCRSIDDLRELKRRSEYVFLRNATAFTPQQLESAAGEGLIDKKVYAIGGVSQENIPWLKSLGFGGCVVCSDLWRHFDIHQQADFKEIVVHYLKLARAAW